MKCPRCGGQGIKPNTWKKKFKRDDYVCLKCGFPCKDWAQYRDEDFMKNEEKDNELQSMR